MMANIVLIGGTHHGGWYFDAVKAALTDFGHAVFAPSLSGLDIDKEAPNYPVNLDTHINDALRTIEQNSLSEVLLVGHSYGGMVITGVASRTIAKVKGLIYLDAPVPEPGQSLWNIVDDQMHQIWTAATLDGLNIYPNPDFVAIRPNLRPHPLATKLQPIAYEAGALDGLKKVYIYAQDYFRNPEMKSPFTQYLETLSSKAGWSVESWAVGHDIVAEVPERVVELIHRTSLEEN
jgi:pimeloyl-ACP methyl ester carboxylesterase